VQRHPKKYKDLWVLPEKAAPTIFFAAHHTASTKQNIKVENK
jgi:hypothetical protein